MGLEILGYKKRTLWVVKWSLFSTFRRARGTQVVLRPQRANPGPIHRSCKEKFGHRINKNLLAIQNLERKGASRTRMWQAIAELPEAWRRWGTC